MAATRPTTLHNTSTTVFAVLRTMVGAASLFAPSLSADLFGVNINYQSRILLRLFGARELALGVLLWRSARRYSLAAGNLSTSSKDEVHQGKRDLRLVLLVGLLIDSIDAVSSGISVWEGSMGGRAIWLVGVGAAGFAVLGDVALQTM